MKINEGMEITGLFLNLKKEDALVFSDVHMGYEEALNKQGILIPRNQYQLTAESLKSFMTGKKFKIIIINGDIKHEFGKISETEWRHTLRLIDFLATKCNQLILVKGNHDKTLGPIADKRNIKVVDSLNLGDVLITHGDVIPESANDEKIKTIIIGHEHPAVTVIDYPRSEKFKCFLKGTWENKQLIVLPSYNLITEGTDVLKEKLLSPFLNNIDEFNAYIPGDDMMDFGLIKDLKKLNKQNFGF